MCTDRNVDRYTECSPHNDLGESCILSPFMLPKP